MCGFGFRTPAVILVSDVYKGKRDRRKDGGKKTYRHTERLINRQTEGQKEMKADTKRTDRRTERDEGGYKTDRQKDRKR